MTLHPFLTCFLDQLTSMETAARMTITAFGHRDQNSPDTALDAAYTQLNKCTGTHLAIVNLIEVLESPSFKSLFNDPISFAEQLREWIVWKMASTIYQGLNDDVAPAMLKSQCDALVEVALLSQQIARETGLSLAEQTLQALSLDQHTRYERNLRPLLPQMSPEPETRPTVLDLLALVEDSVLFDNNHAGFIIRCRAFLCWLTMAWTQNTSLWPVSIPTEVENHQIAYLLSAFRDMIATDRPAVYIVERREWIATLQSWTTDTTVMHVASSLELAERWLNSNSDNDNAIWWWAVTRDSVDGPLVEDHRLRYYDRHGNHIQRPPRTPETWTITIPTLQQLLDVCVASITAQTSWGNCSDWSQAATVWQEKIDQLAHAFGAFYLRSDAELLASTLQLIDIIDDIEQNASLVQTASLVQADDSNHRGNKLIEHVRMYLTIVRDQDSVGADDASVCEALYQAFIGLHFYANEWGPTPLSSLARIVADLGIVPLLRAYNTRAADAAVEAIERCNIAGSDVPTSLMDALAQLIVPRAHDLT
jgi:hypothetical protein